MLALELVCFSAVGFSDLHSLKTSPFFFINKTLGEPRNRWCSAGMALISCFCWDEKLQSEIYRHPLVDIVVNNSSKLHIYPMLSEPKRLFPLARFRKTNSDVIYHDFPPWAPTATTPGSCGALFNEYHS